MSQDPDDKAFCFGPIQPIIAHMGIKVLVVDDAPFIREVVRFALTASGYEVVGEASDGQAAVEMALQTQPDIILMDLVMPKMSGLEATKEILNHQPDQRIIAFTTIDQNAMVMKAIEAGCIHYITKPFQKKELLQAIETSLDKTRKN